MQKSLTHYVSPPSPALWDIYTSKTRTVRITSAPRKTCCKPRASVDTKMEQAQLTECLGVAHKMADAAARVVSTYFRMPIEIDEKADESPVTIADRAAERAMRTIINDHYPNHSIFGEEEGLLVGSGGGQNLLWVLDPIDGTKSFITGKPLFGILISLLEDGVPVLGILDQPFVRERWVGINGVQTQLNGKPITTRRRASLDSAFMYATSPHMFEGPSLQAYERIRSKVKLPQYGCDCYAYGLLAAGFCDLVVEADMKPYDYMALVPIVNGAGGCMTDWNGQPLVWDGVNSSTDSKWPGEVLAAGDKALHLQALKALEWGDGL